MILRISILKSEMFYGIAKSYQTINYLTKEINEYGHDYNHDRIKVKLNGLSPVSYRLQSIS